jgi:hypothetical protein
MQFIGTKTASNISLRAVRKILHPGLCLRCETSGIIGGGFVNYYSSLRIWLICTKRVTRIAKTVNSSSKMSVADTLRVWLFRRFQDYPNMVLLNSERLLPGPESSLMTGVVNFRKNNP